MAYKVILLIFLLLNDLLIYSLQYIPITFYHNADHFLCQLILGNQANIYTLPIDLTSEYTWIYPPDINQFPLLNSIIIKNNTIFRSVDNGILTGLEVKTSFNLLHNDNKTTMELQDFQLLVVNHSVIKEYKRRGSLGLSFKFNDNSTSFIHQYHSEGLIDYLTFGIKSTLIDKGILYLGGFPDDIAKNKNQSECAVSGLSNLWECSTPNVTIQMKEKKYEYIALSRNAYGYFDTIEKNTLAPKKFIDMLLNEVFKDLIDQGKCFIHHKKNQRELSCFYEFMILGGQITFQIGDYEYRIIMYHFWICYDQFCWFKIIENPYNNKWVFGRNFIWYFDLMFDYTKRKIMLYSDAGIGLHYNPYSPMNNNKVMKLLMVNNCVFLLIGSCFLLRNKVYYR